MATPRTTATVAGKSEAMVTRERTVLLKLSDAELRDTNRAAEKAGLDRLSYIRCVLRAANGDGTLAQQIARVRAQKDED